EAERIAKITMKLSEQDIPADNYAGFRQIHADVVRMLNSSLDAFARLDVEASLRVFSDDEDVDEAFNALVRRSIDWIQETPESAEHYVNLIWAARALERIGDHCKNIAEYVIYQVKGQDVRHSNPQASVGFE
ncbi:MAG: phosphate transport system protein, partial [Limisphaerales bacterium]